MYILFISVETLQFYIPQSQLDFYSTLPIPSIYLDILSFHLWFSIIHIWFAFLWGWRTVSQIRKNVHLEIVQVVLSLHLLSQYCFTIVPFSNRSQKICIVPFYTVCYLVCTIYSSHCTIHIWQYIEGLSQYCFALQPISQEHKKVL